jgi:hypothetical protein
LSRKLASRAFWQFTTPQPERFAALLRDRLNELNPVKEQSNSGQVRSNSAQFCIAWSSLRKDEYFFSPKIGQETVKFLISNIFTHFVTAITNGTRPTTKLNLLPLDARL